MPNCRYKSYSLYIFYLPFIVILTGCVSLPLPKVEVLESPQLVNLNRGQEQDSHARYLVPGTNLQIDVFTQGQYLYGCRMGDTLGQKTETVNNWIATNKSQMTCFHLDQTGIITKYEPVEYPILISMGQSIPNPFLLVDGTQWIINTQQQYYNMQQNLSPVLPTALLADGRSCSPGHIPINVPKDKGKWISHLVVRCWNMKGGYSDPT